MGVYVVTAFSKNGEKLLDESFTAQTEAEAKETGERLLREKGLYEHTHRCTSSSGKLVLFQR